MHHPTGGSFKFVMETKKLFVLAWHSTWQEYIVKLLAFPITCTVVVCGSFILSYIPFLINEKEFLAGQGCFWMFTGFWMGFRMVLIQIMYDASVC